MAGKRRRNAKKLKKPQDPLPGSPNEPLEPSPTESPKGKSPSDTRPSRRPSVHLTAEDFDKYQSHCHRMKLSQVGYYPDTNAVIIDYRNIQDEVHFWTDAFAGLSSLVFLASPVNAVWWKSVTLSLANLKEDDMAKSSRDKTPYEFGDRSRKRQASMAKDLADQLLADSLFQLLLRKLTGAEEETARRERLVKLFQDIARALTNHEVMLGGQVKVHQLPELEQFDTSTGLMFSAKFQSEEQEDPPLYVPKPRGRVILVVRPGVCRYDTPIQYVPFSHRPLRLEELEEEPTSWLICKAEVLMETVRTDRSSDKFESDPEDKDVRF
ncbi:similar to An02g06510 [Aspergillus luchuensis]|uniref:Similar to An02g06510 n=1 Tax=Aspergillus kawachii TaxID=1069201 RepID=A0A146FNJ9_ASPKA|nr:similar to An02g06510 [Aspergillus luchuensis]